MQLFRGFPSYHPLLKLGLWVLAIVVSAAAVQAIGWLISADFDILSQGGGGRGVLLALALATLLVLMAADRRPAADYGLAIGGDWARHWFGGLGLGIVTYSAYCALAWLGGAWTVQTDSLSTYRCFSATAGAMTAIPVAVTQQVIFSGYMLSSLRDRYRPMVAVLVSAVLFAVLSQLDKPAALLSGEGLPLAAGFFLIGTLLGILRLRFGSIPFPAGLLAGWIFVRRMLKKTSLVALSGESDLSAWMMPGRDPRQAPFLWAFLAVGIGIAYYFLRRHGEHRAAADQPALDASFKRIMPFSNLNALAPLDLWLTRLFDARFRVGLKYIPRLIAILVFSTFNTILSLPERLIAPWLLRLRRREEEPVFIVGVHRSGTTHLHNLLSLDPRFVAPKTYHIINPVGWITGGWLTTPLFGPFMTWKRPMDNVQLTIFAPQEEEFAVAGMCRQSPYWGMTFPQRGAEYDRYIFPDAMRPKELKTWQRAYMLFLSKLTFWSRKQPLLKSPYNTGRVAALRKLYPRAKFVHICRHPYTVYKSNMHMAEQGLVVFQLQDPDQADSYATRFLANYRELEETFARDAAELPSGDVARVRFEDLERDPVGQVRRIYAELGLEFDARLERRLTAYLQSVSGYKKNRHRELPEHTQREIDAELGPFLDAWGYRDAESTAAQPRRAA